MLAGISLVRDAQWMTRERALAYRNILLVAFLLSTVVLITSSRGGLDLYDRPIGTDFISFWTASQIALSGAPEEVYNVSVHWAAQKALFNDASLSYTAFFYPPVFLLICLPLALLPYYWSLACWLVMTGYICWKALARLGRGSPLSILAFPAVWLNVMHGQNGFLTTALFAGMVSSLEEHPIFAGMCLGCLFYKPHFLIMAPFVLVADRRWATLAAAVGTSTILCIASFAIFGVDTWRAFLSDTTLARAALEQNLVGNDKMQSAFAAVRLWGGSIGTAYIVQFAVALTVGFVLVYSCWSVRMREGAGAGIATATLLASPFLLVYDMMLLAIPLVWIMRESSETGFLPWEKSTLMVAFVMPLLSPTAAHYLDIPMAPLVIMAMFAVVVRRLLHSAPAYHLPP